MEEIIFCVPNANAFTSLFYFCFSALIAMVAVTVNGTALVPPALSVIAVVFAVAAAVVVYLTVVTAVVAVSIVQSCRCIRCRCCCCRRTFIVLLLLLRFFLVFVVVLSLLFCLSLMFVTSKTFLIPFLRYKAVHQLEKLCPRNADNFE